MAQPPSTPATLPSSSVATFSPSHEDITRRRIYDIIHVLSCVGLLRRISYRLYSWAGWESMQSLFTALYSVSVVFPPVCHLV